MLAGPAFAVMLLVTAYPIVQALYYSLFSYRLTDPHTRTFVGLHNYFVALSDELFWRATGQTLLITVITVAIELVLGMIIALVMHRVVIPRKTLRTIVLIPYSIITVVSAFAWFFGFNVTTGFVNWWLHTLTAGTFPNDYNWFSSWGTATAIICFSEIWKTTPFMSLLLLSGLAQVDEALEEAARVDGATFTQTLFKVTLPNMKPAIMVAVLFRTLDAFRIFDNVFIMTGGSHDTTVLSLLAYNQTINRVEIGLGSAISTLLFMFVIMIATGFIKGFKVNLTEGRS
ncbi:carbohydrate ABC transporter permease [Dermatophilus congolensis]|nr:sugar ABC transporter permease [Dermatophilus congolensis]MBO3129732.1 sugar ABC transporter permease [Dermatophilus congolensis]MBO3131638.1 sugar ABC transporter permease [Dermatophilus congolensis]MBO3134206.1 sugar ABC transporter permease [Dermatophilus congolensis]MBO3136439.1 sugar ABC transporter permease [Dermatophilus congolensis]MBO3138688.1 sugar ABC transporter permease [Dermatophilus congolensis]